MQELIPTLQELRQSILGFIFDRSDLGKALSSYLLFIQVFCAFIISMMIFVNINLTTEAYAKIFTSFRYID